VTSQPVFISYSRRDYYFAESLAVHLARRDVESWLDVRSLEPGTDWQRELRSALETARCVIVVLSPDSVDSEQVRDEWAQARAHNKRIVLARFRRAEVPEELADCPIVDFRCRFEPAVDRFVRVLEDPPPSDASPRSAPSWPMPPWVTVLTAMLALLTLFPLVAADYSTDFADESTLFRWSVWALVPLALGLYVWHFLIAFARRRMGLNRLVGCFAFFVWSLGYPLLQHLAGPAVPQLFPEPTMRLVRDSPLGLVGLLLMPLAGLVIVVWLRPADLLRWSPTGKAWASYREKHSVAARAHGLTGVSKLGAIERFSMVYDTPDEPAATRLREELAGSGAVEAPGDAAETTSVILLTNRSRISWVDRLAGELPHSLVTVVGTGIRLPETLRWLWRRQWIDFRRWNLRQAEGGLPGVPEALSRLRVPALVSRAHHLLCALGGLLFVIGSEVLPETTEETATMTLPEVVGTLSALLTLAWGLLARRWLRRTVSQSAFYRWLVVCWASAVVLGIWDLSLLATGRPAQLGALPAALFLLAAPAWFWRRRAALRFWLPTDAARPKRGETLSPGRNWRTLLLFFVYAFVWMVLLQPFGLVTP
jgi:hypothetical protein